MKPDSKHFKAFFTGAADPKSPAEKTFVVVRSVKRSLLAELRSGPTDGSCAQPEEILRRWPGDPRSDADVASLLFEDYHRRRREGDTPSREDYAERFPEHQDSLAELFHRQDFLQSISKGSSASTPILALPEVGDQLFRFCLRKELGAGAFARVYLAEQADLAGRPVVVKVSDTEGDEPQTLAQMQHTAIVPIYSVHENPEAGLRVVCMPYFGGASLSRVMQELWKATALPTQGQQFVEALGAVGGPPALAAESGTGSDAQSVKPADTGNPTTQGTLAQLGRMDYLRATAWIVAQLADGLQHAHQRGVLHRDIKPSNILVGADGQPMLLDFNLSQNLNGERAHVSATLGGTVAYMAPEHLRALASRDPAMVRLVDQRSDIYSLGMVLYEMLAGHGPFQHSASYAPMPMVIEAMAVERARAAPSVRERRPDVPWSLESIVRKCLAPKPAQRYQKPEDLGEDLRRFLDHRPLRHAPELSRVECVRKWLRRHPQATSTGAISTAAVFLLLAIGAALMGVREHLSRTQDELEATQARERIHTFEQLTNRARCLVNTTSDRHEALGSGQAMLEQALGQFGVLDATNWQENPYWRRVESADRPRLAEDIRELLLDLAWARVKVAAGELAVLHDALALLERAEAVPGLAASPALFRARARYLTGLGQTEAAREAEKQARVLPHTGWRDHYLLAIEHGRRGSHAEAIVELKQAIKLKDGAKDYWTHMQLGICHLELKDYDQARVAFSTCVGNWSAFAWAYFNRAVAWGLSGRKDLAVEDYTAALQRDPQFVPAWWNRGLVQLELGRSELAVADFRKTIALGQDDAAAYMALGKALTELSRFTEATAAFQTMFARLASATTELRGRVLCEYGFTVAKRLPEEADKAFAAVLEESSTDRLALYGRGMVAAERGLLHAAVAWFNQALEVHPKFVEARRCRAVLLARLGELNRAIGDINLCLQQDGTNGATWYDAACVVALAVPHSASTAEAERRKKEATEYLRGALARGFGRDKAAADSDLKVLHGVQGFEQLVNPAKRPVDSAPSP